MKHPDPLLQLRDQLIPFPFFHRHQQLHKAQTVLFAKALGKPGGLLRDHGTGFQQSLCLTQIAAGSGNGGRNILGGCLWEALCQLPLQYPLGQGVQLQLRTAGTDGGQQCLRIIRQQHTHRVSRWLLQNLQQGVLSLHTKGLGEDIYFFVRFIGTNKHILPVFLHHFDRHLLMVRVCDGDNIRVVAGHSLPAGVAPQTGLVCFLAYGRSCQQLCQGALTGAFRSADQVEMGKTAPGSAGF